MGSRRAEVDLGRQQWIAYKCPSISPNGRWCWQVRGSAHKEHESRGVGGIVEKWTDEDVKPIGIADLLEDKRLEMCGVGSPTSLLPLLKDHWYWCRHHERAEHVTQPDSGIYKGSDWKCVRIGPFMSEREAERLRDAHPEYPEGDRPLGMKVEQ